MRIIGGLQDTRRNNEDFAITPFLFAVCMKGKIIQVYGLGLCWGFYAVYLGVGFNIPKKYPSFSIIRKKIK